MIMYQVMMDISIKKKIPKIKNPKSKSAPGRRAFVETISKLKVCYQCYDSYDSIPRNQVCTRCMPCSTVILGMNPSSEAAFWGL